MMKAELAQTMNRSRVAVLAIGAVCALRVLNLAVMQLQVDLLERMQRGEVVSLVEASGNDQRVRIVAMLHLVGWFVSGVLFLYWVHSAHARARDFGREGRPLPTPGGAVVSFFIPFVALVRPFSHMRDLLWASDPADLELPPEVRERAAPTYRDQALEAVPVVWKRPRVFVGAWWVGYLIMSFMPLLRAFPGAGHGRVDLEALISTAYSQMMDDVVRIGVGVLCIGVVRGVTRCQVERFRRLRLLARK